MKYRAGVFGIFLAISSQAFGQVQFSEQWAGTWRLERVDRKIRLSGESAIKLSGNVITNPEDTSLGLNGEETSLGPVVVAFRPVNSSEFEILSRLQVKDAQYQEVSRFVFSANGKTLTETKTQTKRTVAHDKADEAKSASTTKSSTTVLIFARAD